MIYGNIKGVRFGISVGFCLLLSFLLYVDKTGWILPSFLATVLHEAGHLAAMVWCGCKPKEVSLRVGAVRLCGSWDKAAHSECLIASAGPLANLVGGGVLLLLYAFFRRRWILGYAAVMLVLGTFHLLPIIGLDGGTVLYCWLRGKGAQKVIFLLRQAISSLFLSVLLLGGLLLFIRNYQNPSLLLLAFYLIFGVFLSKKQKE